MDDLQSLCFLCQKPLISPLKTTCQHVFCQKCILNWLTENLMCPCNCGILFTNELIRVQNLNQISDNLHYRCPNYRNGCPLILMRKEIKSHIKNECKFPRNISMNSQTPTSKTPNPLEKMGFFNNFLENFLEKIQISNFIQPQIDVINEFLHLLVFIENIRVSQIKFLDITSEIYKNEDKSLYKEFKDIKENLHKIDLKPLNSHLLLISDKINIYIENAKLAYQNCRKKKPQTSNLLSNKPIFLLGSQNLNQQNNSKSKGFLTSQRENIFSKSIKTKLENNKKSSSKKQIEKTKKVTNDNKEESLEKTKKRLLLQQNRLLKITTSKGVLDESLEPDSSKKKLVENPENKINSGSQHYLLGNFSRGNNDNPSKKNSAASFKNSGSIRKTRIDLTGKKNQDSPYDVLRNSLKSSKFYERNSNRFQRGDNRSIKNTTSSSSGSHKVIYYNKIILIIIK